MLDTLALVATALGVSIGAWQLRVSMRLAQTTFEDSIDQQYRVLAARVPMDVWLGKAPSPEIEQHAREIAFQYLDLCNEQILLRKLRRISDGRWRGWLEGIEENMGIPLIRDVWDEVLRNRPGHLSNLARLHDTEYRVDPKWWQLLLQSAVLAPQLREFLALGTGEQVTLRLGPAVIGGGLANTVRHILGTDVELLVEFLRGSAATGQLDDLLTKLGGVWGSCSGHLGAPSRIVWV